MGIMFWLWIGFWILGWAVLIVIHFVSQSRNKSDQEDL